MLTLVKSLEWSSLTIEQQYTLSPASAHERERNSKRSTLSFASADLDPIAFPDRR